MKTKLAVFAAMLATTSPAAFAATVTVNHVYNPANIVQANITGEALAAPIVLGVGDTLDMTITFTGGQTVFANGEDGLWGLVLTSTGPGGTLQTTGTLEFIGASANVVAGPIALGQSNSFIHLGSFYSSASYRLDGNTISFTGLNQIITINSDDIGQPREYQRIALTYFQGEVGAVPEPATWALMIGGFGLAGTVLRRRGTSVVFG